MFKRKHEDVTVRCIRDVNMKTVQMPEEWMKKYREKVKAQRESSQSSNRQSNMVVAEEFSENFWDMMQKNQGCQMLAQDVFNENEEHLPNVQQQTLSNEEPASTDRGSTSFDEEELQLSSKEPDVNSEEIRTKDFSSASRGQKPHHDPTPQNTSISSSTLGRTKISWDMQKSH